MRLRFLEACAMSIWFIRTSYFLFVSVKPLLLSVVIILAYDKFARGLYMAERVKCLVLFAQKCYILADCGGGLAYPADCVCVCLSIFVQSWCTVAKRLSRSSRFWCEGCGYHRRQLLRESGVAHGKKDLPRGMMKIFYSPYMVDSIK